jgi:hypothetical protein
MLYANYHLFVTTKKSALNSGRRPYMDLAPNPRTHHRIAPDEPRHPPRDERPRAALDHVLRPLDRVAPRHVPRGQRGRDRVEDPQGGEGAALLEDDDDAAAPARRAQPAQVARREPGRVRARRVPGYGQDV